MKLKVITSAVLAGLTMVLAVSAYASHLGYKSTHIILGKAYFYSLNIQALITSLTGKDIKDGTQLKADVKILTSNTACSNPQTHVVFPGVGPKGDVFLASDALTANNLVKSDRTKSTFSTTATGELDLGFDRLTTNMCKDSPGSSQWNQLFWQDRNCIKGQSSGNTCYSAYAAFDNAGILRYVTGPNAGQPVPSCDNSPSGACEDPPGTYIQYYNWTFVFLPTTFVLNAFVTTASTEDPDSNNYYSCQFKPNNETGAIKPGEPYSISNPPVNGWGGVPPAEYACTEITAAQYESY